VSGHSKWSTIKHQKGAKDARRGKLFARLIRAIEVAAREGGSNPDGNPTLADAIQKARDNSVPNETIERAIKRGAGELGGQKLELQTYEGYGPGGVAILIEALTDNRNRTAAEIRRTFNRGGGSLADAGSVAYLFTRKGEVIVLVGGDVEDPEQEDRVLEVALEAGAEDVVGGAAGFTVTAEPAKLGAIRAAFDAAGIAYESAQVTMVPSVSVPVEGEDALRVLRLLDAVEELDDVQDVYANFDISDEVMAQVG
jgi:YebC/PmpR family DNA-binding regulatory protein